LSNTGEYQQSDGRRVSDTGDQIEQEKNYCAVVLEDVVTDTTLVISSEYVLVTLPATFKEMGLRNRPLGNACFLVLFFS
jgi:hypothetical protein